MLLRPKNNASVVRVPYSPSNLSINGTNANTLRIVCIMLRCIRGKVVNRYAIAAHLALQAIILRDIPRLTGREADLVRDESAPLPQVPD